MGKNNKPSAPNVPVMCKECADRYGLTLRLGCQARTQSVLRVVSAQKFISSTVRKGAPDGRILSPF